MNTNIAQIFTVFLIILTSVILHELSHGVVAYWLGDRTAKDAGRLTLNPLKHIDPYMSILVPVVLYLLNAPVFGGAKPVPVNYRNLKWHEWGMAIVAAAGPLTNFLIALITFLIGYFAGVFFNVSSFSYFLVTEIIFINLGFMIFNLLPIPPLDGSRVLYAIAPDSARAYLDKFEPYGIIVVYALILFLGQVFQSFMANGINGIWHFFWHLVGY